MTGFVKKIISLGHQVATRCIRACQSLLGISTLGARAIVLNQQNQVLLVKHTYHQHWYLPGGGVNRGESFQAAIIRELKEEVGVVTNVSPQLFGIYYHTYMGAHDYPAIFIVTDFSLIKSNSPEIEQTGWFDYQSLPEVTSPGTKRRLDEYFSKVPREERW